MTDSIDEELSAPKTKEIRAVLRNIGVIDPRNIEDYFAYDGYLALGKVLSEMSLMMSSSWMQNYGRGGAGFPTGFKMAICKTS